MPSTISTSAQGGGLPFQATMASTTDRLPCTADPAMMMWRRSKRRASTPPTGEASSTPQLGEGHQPDEGAGVRQLVGQRNQRDVLHPGADVGCGGPGGNAPERLVAQRRADGPVAPPTPVTGA
nr:hypothetical protein [Candidatus Microthrix sp.]